MARRDSALRLVSAILGLAVWALHFLFVYVFAALACARGFAGRQVAGVDIVVFVVAAATVVAVAALGVHALRERRAPAGTEQPAGFLSGLGLLVDGLALVAILMTAAALIVPSCG